MLLWSVAIAMSGVGVMMVLLAAILPLESAGPTEQSGLTRPGAIDSVNDLPPSDTFDKVCALRLQRPLFESAPAVAAQAPDAPALPLHLTGTIVERGHSSAIFQSNTGEIELRNIGERLDGAEVLSVSRDSAQVKYGGQVIDLKVEQPSAEVASVPPTVALDFPAIATDVKASDAALSVPVVSEVHPPPAIASDDVVYVLPLSNPTTKPASGAPSP